MGDRCGVLLSDSTDFCAFEMITMLGRKEKSIHPIIQQLKCQSCAHTWGCELLMPLLLRQHNQPKHVFLYAVFSVVVLSHVHKTTGVTANKVMFRIRHADVENDERFSGMSAYTQRTLFQRLQAPKPL